MSHGIIRGYAVPYDQPGTLDDVVETIAPGAIDLVNFTMVQLQFGIHHGPVIARTLNGSLRLFNDNYGLAFEAQTDMSRDGFFAYSEIARGAVDQCSINMIIDEADETTVDGVRHRRVQRAHIDHIAVMRDTIYTQTAAWAPSVFSHRFEMPARVRDAADRWQAGDLLNNIAAKHRRTESARSLVASSRPRTSTATVLRPPAVAARDRADSQLMAQIDALLASRPEPHRRGGAGVIP